MTIVPRTSEGSASSAPLTTAWYQPGKSSLCFGRPTSQSVAGREREIGRGARTFSGAFCTPRVQTLPCSGEPGRLLLLDVPVDDGAGVALLLQEVGELVGDHDRAVVAPRAPHGNGQVVAALLDVAGQQEPEQVPHPGEELPGRLLPEHVAAYPAVQAGEGPELLHPVGVREEADIEDQVGVEGDAVLVAEGDHVHGDPGPGG